MKHWLCLLALVVLAPAARADEFFQAFLLPGNEIPANNTSAFGLIAVDLHSDFTTLDVVESFFGLAAPATAAHIHCCGGPSTNDPVALAFTGFPNTSNGLYFQTFNLTTDLSAAFVAANGGTASAVADFIAGLEGGNTYANIHDSVFPGGEIRGQLSMVPEPGTLGLMGGCLAALAFLRRRRA